MDYALPIAFALLLWWFTTGAIFYLDALPARTYKWSMAGATLVLGAAFWLIWSTADQTGQTAAYLAFTGGLLAWGWQEISLYTGYVTGPRKVSCPADCKGWRHFGHAIQVNLWHELAIIAMAGALALMVWEAENKLGLWTYLLLWGMHLSARLNVFLGVRNVSEEFVPPHMAVLKSFMRQKPMNLLFPLSVTGATVGSVLLFGAAAAAGSDHELTAFSLLGALMTLALVEHWFLVVPLPVEKLWRWSLPQQDRAAKLRNPPPPKFDYTVSKITLTP